MLFLQGQEAGDGAWAPPTPTPLQPHRDIPHPTPTPQHGLWLPLQEGDALGAMEKLCRQLTYHLSPHSQWRRHRGLVKRKPQAW